MQYGVMEAFSFRKGVVKIDGQWLRFGPEAEGAIRELSVGDRVGYLVHGRSLKWVEKARQAAPKAAMQNVPAVAQKAANGSILPVSGASDCRNRSIERQTALKAAVELAQLLGYKSTDQCLDVAATFAAWIETGGAAAGQAAGFPPSSL